MTPRDDAAVARGVLSGLRSAAMNSDTPAARKVVENTTAGIAALDALTARLEAAKTELENPEDYVLASTHHAIAGREHNRAEAAEARVKELEAALRKIRDTRIATTSSREPRDDEWQPISGCSAAEIARAALGDET